MKKAAVTGGGGFIGQAIVRRLLKHNVEPVVIGRSRYPEIDALEVETRNGDIRDPDFLRTAFRDCDTVFHVAGKAGIWGKWTDFHTTNVIGTENVIAACQANNIARLIHTSTPSVIFDRIGISGANENIPYAKSYLCHYAHTKAIAEQRVRAANHNGLRTCAIRPHLVWGPGDNHLIPRLVALSKAGKLRRVGNGQNLVDITYIDNAAQAHLLAAKNLENSGSAAGKAYFISQGDPVYLWEWVNLLLRRLGAPVVTRRISYRHAYWTGALLEKVYNLLNKEEEPPMTRFLAEQLAKSHWFTLERAERDLGYTPEISQQEGLQRTIEWLKSGRMQ